ncbi:hypothetical protein ES703_110871 [subsurface metagenome]
MILEACKNCGKAPDNDFKKIVPLNIIPDGCFIWTPQKKNKYFPGCYVYEGSQDVNLVKYHELAHAFMFANKKYLIDCKWIEEGLAEYFSFNYLKKPLIVKQLEYYNYLEPIKKKSRAQIQNLIDKWLNDKKITFFCDEILKFYYS